MLVGVASLLKWGSEVSEMLLRLLGALACSSLVRGVFDLLSFFFFFFLEEEEVEVEVLLLGVAGSGGSVSRDSEPSFRINCEASEIRRVFLA